MKTSTGSRLRSGIIVGFFLLAGVGGCAGLMGPQKRVATPAELEQFGTRTYSGYDKAAVQQAVMTALKVQGYEVVTAEPRIRTSPKLVHVSATSSYGETSGSSSSFAESVAWDIDVQDGQPGASLHAVPRASVNGMAMEQMYYDYAERTFGELMKEIDASLPAKSAEPAEPAKPAEDAKPAKPAKSGKSAKSVKI